MPEFYYLGSEDFEDSPSVEERYPDTFTPEERAEYEDCEMSTTVSAKIEENELVIRLPLNTPPCKSASGKTMIVASSHGNQPTECKVGEETIIVGVNAYYRLPK